MAHNTFTAAATIDAAADTMPTINQHQPQYQFFVQNEGPDSVEVHAKLRGAATFAKLDDVAANTIRTIDLREVIAFRFVSANATGAITA